MVNDQMMLTLNNFIQNSGKPQKYNNGW